MNNSGSGIYLREGQGQLSFSGNEISFNGGDGISVYESAGTNLSSNKMEYNKGAGLRLRNSRNVTSYKDYSGYNKDFGFIAYGANTKASLIDLRSVSNKGSLKTDHTGHLTFSFTDAENIFGGDLSPVKETVLKELQDHKTIQIDLIPEERK